ncbi:MAG TPA: type II toxin-antitoxin system antitoxin SocA domain-containing protein [Acidimicrobiales bacterium]
MSAHDVARELRRRVPDAGLAQVHKWSYYAQAWHLILTGRPLFYEQIEAYAHGPVVAPLWRAEHYGSSPPPRQPLDDTGRLVLDLVLETYGSWPAWKLKQQTHREGPWRDIKEYDGPGEPSPVITHENLVEWFESTGEAEQVRARAFAREDKDPDHAQRVDELRSSGPYGPQGRPIDRNVLAALAQATSGDHVNESRP